MAGAFGQSAAPCGRCSACRNGRLLADVPDIGGMREWQVRAFVLQWQRDAIAARRTCLPMRILSDATLSDAAKKLVFPEYTSVPEEMERVLAHLRRERMHESESG